MKMENQNPGRSIKDRAALHILQGIIQDQKLKTDPKSKRLLSENAKGEERPTVYEGTSGNTGISLGLLANYFGMQTSIYLNNDLAEEKVVFDDPSTDHWSCVGVN